MTIKKGASTTRPYFNISILITFVVRKGVVIWFGLMRCFGWHWTDIFFFGVGISSVDVWVGHWENQIGKFKRLSKVITQLMKNENFCLTDAHSGW